METQEIQYHIDGFKSCVLNQDINYINEPLISEYPKIQFQDSVFAGREVFIAERVYFYHCVFEDIQQLVFNCCTLLNCKFKNSEGIYYNCAIYYNGVHKGIEGGDYSKYMNELKTPLVPLYAPDHPSQDPDFKELKALYKYKPLRLWER